MSTEITLNGTIVKKHNMLIRTEIDIRSVIASRALALLISCISTEDTDFKEEYKVSINPLIQNNNGGKDYEEIDNACDDLAKALALVDVGNGNGKKRYPFFRMVQYKEGHIYAQFNDLLKPLLLNLQGMFTQYSLAEYLALNSLYSQRIFEIIKSIERLGTFDMDIEDLHDYIKAPPSMRKDFSRLRTRVLDKAVKDILDIANYKFKWEAIYKGNRVDKIRFITSKKRKAVVEAKERKKEIVKQSKDNNLIFQRAMTCYEGKKGERCFGSNNETCRICLKLIQEI